MQDSSEAVSVTQQHLSLQQIKDIQSRSFRDGVKACSPSLIGIAAWGVVVGVAMMKTNFTLAQAFGMTLIVFAGSAQLAALPLIAVNTPVWVIFLTGLIVNLRFVIFSVIIAPHFRGLSLRQKIFWGYMTGDVSMVYFMNRFPSEQPEIGKFEYMKGLFVANAIAWQIGSIAGILMANLIPDSWQVGFAGTLAILCVLLPMILNRAALVGVIVAGAVAVAAHHWPFRLGMLLAVIVGMIVSIRTTQWQERGQSRASSNPGDQL